MNTPLAVSPFPAARLCSRFHRLLRGPLARWVAAALLLGIPALPAARAQGVGSFDSTFQNPVTDQPVTTLAVQSDGKIIIGGGINSLDGVDVGPVSRLNADGTPDTSFSTAAAIGANSSFPIAQPHVALQSDGKILIAGTNFATGKGIVVRVDATGKLDTTFSLTTDGYLTAIAVQSNGDILVGGLFSAVNGAGSHNGLVRVNSVGQVDPTFTAPTAIGGQPLLIDLIASLLIQSDGSIVVAASGVNYNDSNGAGLFRVDSTGKVDPAFAFTFIANATINAATLQPDGKVVFVGNFSAVNGHARNLAARVSGVNGQLDGFTPDAALLAQNPPEAVIVLANGDIAIGGNNAPVIALRPTGALDNRFTASFNSTDQVKVLAVDANAKLLVGGTLTVNGVSEVGVARLLTTAVTTGSTLTATAFAVNGSAQPSPVASGAAITFTATQGAAASTGVYVRVQATDSPNTESSWTDLSDTTNGGAGFLASDGAGNYTLTTTMYPTGSRIYFRAISAASGQTDSISNVVGPFDLTNAGTPNLAIDQTASTPDSPNASVAIIGDQITYKLFVRNYGPATATNVIVRDTLPSNLTLTSADAGYTITNGNTITYTFPTLTPNGTNPVTLTLVASVNADTPIGTVITNNGYSVAADGAGIVQGSANIDTTTIIPPLEVIVSGDGSSVTPGETLTYFIDVTNKSPGTINGIKISVPIPDSVQFKNAGFVDASHQATNAPNNDPENPKQNGTNLIYKVGSLDAGAVSHLQLTVQIPYDVDPTLPIVLMGPQVTTKTSVGGVNSFTLPDTTSPLSGQGAVAPPLISFGKTVIDPLGVLQLFGEQPKLAKKLGKALGAVTADLNLLTQFKQIYPGLASLNLATATLSEVVGALDPDVSYDSSTTPGQLATSTVTAPTASDPTYIAFILPFENDGGATASDVVIQDQVPAGTSIYDPAGAYNGSVIINGKPGDPSSGGNLEISGTTLRFHVGNIKSGKTGYVIYKVRLLLPGEAGAPSVDSVITTTGSVLSSSSLSHTYQGQPDGQPLTVVGRYAYYLESTQYSGNTTPLNAGVTYEIYYQNTGTRGSKVLEIDDPIPAGLEYVGFELLDGNHQSLPGTGVPAGSADVPADPTNGTLVFHPPLFNPKDKGKVKQAESGFIREFFQPLPNALTAGHAVFVHAPFIAQSSYGTQAVRAGAPVAKAARGGRRTRATGGVATASSTNATRVDDPALSRLFLSVVLPMSMVQGVPADVFVAIGSVNDTPISDSHTVAVMTLPAGFTLASESVGTAPANYATSTDASGRTQVSVNFSNGLPAHGAAVAKFQVLAPAGSPSATVAFPGVGLSYYVSGVQLQTGPLNVRVLTPGDAAAINATKQQIAGSALTQVGTPGPQFSEFISQITLNSRLIVVAGAGAVSVTNGAVVVPLLGPGNVLAMGPSSAVVPSSAAASVESTPLDFTLATGPGSAITIGQATGNKGALLPAQSAQAMLGGIGSNAAGNALTMGAANLLHGGGENLIHQDGSSLINQDGNGIISQDGNGLTGVQVSQVVSNDGGSILAAGRSNTNGIIGENSSGIIGENSSGVIGENSSGLLAGGLVISNDGGSIIAVQGGSVLAGAGANIIGENSSGIIGENSSGLLGTADNSVVLHANSAGGLVQVGSFTGLIQDGAAF